MHTQAEGLFVLGILFTFGAIFSIIRTKGALKIFGLEHTYAISLALHFFVGFMAWVIVPSSYAIVVIAMSMIGIVTTALGVVIAIMLFAKNKVSRQATI